MIRVTFWNEFRHEQENEVVKGIYPDGIHMALAAYFTQRPDFSVQTATLDEPDHGLTDDVLATTDVLLWWGHMAHDEVSDAVVRRVQQRVLDGMGLIVLHSGHYSKIFKALLGTTGSLRWRDMGERERLWVLEPGHPIAAGLPPYIEVPAAEMYGERFDIPAPDALIFVSWFEGGEVFRSGCCWQRGAGKLFYFRPGHETHPIYYQPEILQVIENGIRWAAPTPGAINMSDAMHVPDKMS